MNLAASGVFPQGEKVCDNCGEEKCICCTECGDMPHDPSCSQAIKPPGSKNKEKTFVAKTKKDHGGQVDLPTPIHADELAAIAAAEQASLEDQKQSN